MARSSRILGQQVDGERPHNDSIPAALYLAAVALEAGDRVDTARKRLGPSVQQSVTVGGKKRTQVIYPDATPTELRRFAKAEAAAKDPGERLMDHLATAFPVHLRAREQVRQIFNHELSHLNFLKVQDLETLMPPAVPIAILRELLQGRKMWLRTKDNEPFRRFNEKYKPLVLPAIG